MAIRNQFTCFLIGEGTLPIQCAELLLKQGHQIKGVISSDVSVSRFCKDKEIPSIQPTDNLVEVLSQQPFDYLFSIVSYSVLPKEILELPRQLAINYHDALLPRYAGINATSWALMHREKTHGITWHVMSPMVDAGDILKQVSIEISPDETAFTLNGKCYEAAIDSFAQLIDELSRGQALRSKPNLEERTYFGRYKKPAAGGVLSFNRCAEDIDALVRALDFGPYPNPLGLAKLVIDNNSFIVSKLEVLSDRTKSPPGTITAIAPDFVEVSTASYSIALREILTSSGQKLSIPDLVARFGLQVGYQFKDIEPELVRRIEQFNALIAKHEAFWVERLATLQPLMLPYAQKTASQLTSKQYANVAIAVSDEVTTFLEKRYPAWNQGDFLEAAFVAYLARIGETGCFDIGYRDVELHRKLVGLESLFASYVPCRVEIDYEQRFEDVFAAVRNQVKLTKCHLTYVRDVAIRYPTLRSLSLPDCEQMFPVVIERVENLDDYQAESGNELSLVISSDGKKCFWFYNTEVLDGESIARMQEQFTTFLHGIVTDPSQRVAYLPLLSEQERHKILVEWNDTEVEYPQAQCIHQLFEAQVEQSPDAIAVVFEGEQLTYRELNAKANKIAHYLQSLGVGPDVLVGICVERSLEMVVGLLAILKAGGAYVPLDPAYPYERLAFMLEDAAVSVLLAQSWLVESLPNHSARVVCLDTDDRAIALLSESNPISEVTPDNLVYVIYTSGSTGKPKGVMNAHRGVYNRLRWIQQAYQLTSGDSVLQKTPFSFDVSVWEFFWTLMTGARLVMAKPGGHQESAYLVNLILEQQITTLHFVPSLLQIFLEEPGVERCSCLRRVICSGEALPKKLQEHFFARLGCELHNLYGPTEAAIDVTFWQCQPDSNLKTVPIGRPIANTQIYILDQYLQPVPVGVGGELHIGGVGVARGYLNRPDLTTQKFIPDPFSEQPEARLYKTGDKARYLSDGTIEYLGRIDNQVKIRGLRIELGEIESVLSQHPAVQETVAIVREDNPGDKRLVAYIVPNVERAFTVRQLLNLEKDGKLNSHLRYELPNGMAIVHLNRSETDFVYQEIFEEKTYLKHGITLNSESCIFDVGANIGMFSLFMAQTCKDAVIYAFEPIPPVFEVLSLNASLYGLNIKLFDCGLSSEEMDDEFTYYPYVSVISGRFANTTDEQEVVKSFLLNQQSIGNDQTALSSAEIDELLAERLTSQRFNCHLTTISGVIRENGIAQIDLLKIDAEKSEMFVLAGIEEEDWSKIRQIIVEVHDIDGRLEQITTLLKKHGYELTLEQDALLKDTGLYNIYAVRHSLKVPEVPEKTSSISASDNSLIWTSPKRLISDVRHYLTQKLPTYMVPGSFVLLPTLPLSANGKVDRRALPAPAVRNNSDSVVLPSTSTEEILVGIWKDVLGLETVGVRDNFFELGGDSILSIQIISKANSVGFVLTSRQIFQHPTIAELAAVATTTETRKAFQGLVTGSLPLTPIQHWFFAKNLPSPHHWNQAFLLEVPPTLNPDLLQQALQQLLLHHDALRLRFNQSDVCWQQFNALPDETVPFSVIDLSALPENALSQTIESKSSSFQASLNLNSGPLLQVALFHLGTQKPSRLLLVIHHLIVDGVSWRILLEDLQTAYKQLESGKPIQLPAKTTAFKHWAEKLTEYAQSPTATKELTYWSNISTSKITRLPIDCDRGANTEASARRVNVSLNLEETRALLQEIHKAYHTKINDILLTALVQVLATWSGSNSVLIDLEGHGREEILPDVDLSRTVGWFTTIFPMLLELKATENFGDAIKFIKAQLRAIPNRGIGYGLLRYLSQDAAITSQLSSLPQAEVSFNYLGQFDWGMQSDSFVKLAPESVGSTHNPLGQRSHLLEIEGLVVEGQLQLYWTYSENFHERTTIENLAQDFVDRLRMLIAHCLSTDAEGHIPDIFEQLIPSLTQKTNNNQRQKNNVSLHLLEIPEDIFELLPSDTESAYPLAKMQEFMLFHYCNERQRTGVYHCQLSYDIYDESLDLQAFKQALEISVQKHPALRTVFIIQNGTPVVQVVRKNLSFSINEHDISHITLEEQSNYIDVALEQDRQNLFDVENPNEPLVRFWSFQKTEQRLEFLMSIHHAIDDGWSNVEFINQLYQFYLALKKGEEITVVPAANVYQEFVALEKEIIGSLEAANFWKLHLKDYTYKPLKPLNTSVEQVEAVTEEYSFDSGILADVRQLCGKLGVSPKALFLSRAC